MACTERRAAPEPRPVTLAMRGCAQVSRLCEIDEAPLVFFAEDATTATAELDGEALTVRTTPLASGLRIEVDVPARRGTLTVHLPDAEAPRLMRVSVGPVPKPPEAIATAVDGRANAGPIGLAGAANDDVTHAGATQRFADARALYKKGEADEAMRALADSAALADRAQLRSQAARSRLLAVWIATKSLRDFDAARAALAGVPERSPYDGEADVLRAFHAAVLASEVGDRREGLEQIAVARALAERLGDTALAMKCEIRELNTLVHVGRFEEAAARWRALADAGTGDPCLDALAMGNLAWTLMRASNAKDDASAQWFERALAKHTESCSDRDPTHPANLLTSAALYHLERGELDAADSALTRSSALPMLPEHAQWHRIVRGGVALARGDAKGAHGIYARLAELADAARLTEVAWHAWVGVGRSREAAGDVEGAARAYAEAEARTAQEAVLVPIDAGRLHLYGDRDESARRWVALEIARGRPEAALDVVRRARRRALVSIELARRIGHLDGDARERWERDIARYRRTRDALEEKSAALWLVPKDERPKHAHAIAQDVTEARRALDQAIGDLARFDAASLAAAGFRDPAPGELLVTWYPLVEGWAIFARDAARVRAVVVDAAPDAATIVRELTEAIAAADRLTVLAPGGDYSLHRADFSGAPLGKTKPVAYALDLPPREPAEKPARAALVLSDPRGDLKAAREEGDAVVKILDGQGWRVEHAAVDAATRRRFFAGMNRARLLHYAGHGTYEGHEGWDSSLLLADGRLTVGDVLTATTAPEAVVLLGCRTARSDGVGASAGLGIAQAFVLAGAEAVVAATREIADGATADVSSRLFSAIDDGSDLATTYQRTVYGSEEANPEWDAFVLLTP